MLLEIVCSYLEDTMEPSSWMISINTVSNLVCGFKLHLKRIMNLLLETAIFCLVMKTQFFCLVEVLVAHDRTFSSSKLMMENGTTTIMLKEFVHRVDFAMWALSWRNDFTSLEGMMEKTDSMISIILCLTMNSCMFTKTRLKKISQCTSTIKHSVI